MEALHSPSVFHHGNRGLTRDRMLGDYALFQECTRSWKSRRRLSPRAITAWRPANCTPRCAPPCSPVHGWLNEAAPERITNAENLWDWVRAIAFVVGALMVLSSPGLLLASLMPRTDLPLMIVVAMVLSGLTYLRTAAVWRAPRDQDGALVT